MNPKKLHPLHGAHVASHVPGRLRIKLPKGIRKLHVLKQIEDQLQTQNGIHNVEVNHTTGSVTVKYDPERHSMTSIFQLLEDLEVIIADLNGVPVIDETPTNGKALTFIGAVEDLNERLTTISGVKINLKSALPLTFAGIGFWSIARDGLKLEKIPGLLFLWLAIDTFIKLHPHTKQLENLKVCESEESAQTLI